MAAWGCMLSGFEWLYISLSRLQGRFLIACPANSFGDRCVKNACVLGYLERAEVLCSSELSWTTKACIIHQDKIIFWIWKKRNCLVFENHLSGLDFPQGSKQKSSLKQRLKLFFSRIKKSKLPAEPLLMKWVSAAGIDCCLCSTMLRCSSALQSVSTASCSPLGVPGKLRKMDV